VSQQRRKTGRSARGGATTLAGDRGVPDEDRRPIDIAQLWANMTPPAYPDLSFDATNNQLQAIQAWQKTHAISILAGLATDPNYFANGIRLDWLLRLVISKSNGQRKPRQSEWNRVLNAGLERAKVLRLEDPVEDLFCDNIATRRGNFRVFPGQWEAAGAYTQTLLDAFVALPESEFTHETLESVYALLSLSDLVAERAGVHRFIASSGEPKGVLSVPDADVLSDLSKRVRFTKQDLGRLSVSRSALSPFCLDPSEFAHVSDRVIGDTPLEFRPLICSPNSIVVANPANVTLAIRSLLVRAAQRGGFDRALHNRMMLEQQKYSELSGFWPTRTLQLSRPNPHGMRGCVAQYDYGRFLHIIQVPSSFDDFPARGFASVRRLGNEANKFLTADVERFLTFLGEQGDFRQGTTVLLFSGWGTPHSVAPPIPPSAPAGWRYLPLSFADAAVLGACKDGKLTNIIRLLEQQERLEGDGFDFLNLNGLLNLFGFWRSTQGNLIPEHLTDIKPPCNIVLPTDELLEPRTESANKRDFKAIELPEGNWRFVQRLDWSDAEDLQPIYASLDDVSSGRLLGAASFDGRNWWVQTEPSPDSNRDWQYRMWHAILQWLGAVGPKIVAKFPNHLPPGSHRIDVVIPPSREIDATRLLTAPFTGIAAKSLGSGVEIEIQPDWMARLRHPQNNAEVELIATMIHGICNHRFGTLSLTDLAASILDAVGSPDWRWLHAREVVTPGDGLESKGIVGRFREIGLSALSLAKCRSVWRLRSRQDDLEIQGDQECFEFLVAYCVHLLDELTVGIRRFDRAQLCVLAAAHYQRSRLEQSRWRRTIRSLRAIHGHAANVNALAKQNAINAVQRATKIICEIAACEAPLDGGLPPSFSDLQELAAIALLLFGNSQLLASIRGGLDKPHLKISPAGDVLSDRTISESTLRPGAEWTNLRALNASAEEYVRERSKPTQSERVDSARVNDDQLWRAIESEYGVSAASFSHLQYALVDLAGQRGEAEFAIKRSELAKLLSESWRYKSEDPMPILRRLTLHHRLAWRVLSDGMQRSDTDVSRFDRPFSIINRPLVALDESEDPRVLCCPMFVSDALMYSLSGLMEGALQGRYWTSASAVKLAGANANAKGKEFEDLVADKIARLGTRVIPRCELSWALNQKVPKELGNIDVLVISTDEQRVWVVEAKNLKLCRTEAEVASRLSDYRGRVVDGKPDKMFKHLRRVRYLRDRRERLCQRLDLNPERPPEVKALLVVDSPQPMNFHMLDQIEDAESTRLDEIEQFSF
jgi:hypothetical protein